MVRKIKVGPGKSAAVQTPAHKGAQPTSAGSGDSALGPHGHQLPSYKVAVRTNVTPPEEEQSS
jgi:hypothetical protein